MIKRKTYNNENILLDLLKFFACFLIVGSHGLPLFKNEDLNYFYGQWLFRFCVPVFIISCGYFFSKMDNVKKKNYIIRLVILYVVSTIIYAPFAFVPYQSKVTSIKHLILGFHHLWYISGMIGGLLIFYLFNKKITSTKTSSIITLIIIFICFGAFFDEYYKLIHISQIQNIGLFCYTHFNGGRNFLFFVFPLILIGYLINRYQDKFKIKPCLILLPISFIVSFIESLMLKKYIGYTVSADITLVNYIPAILLVILVLKIKVKYVFNTKLLRKIADYIYIIHPIVIYYFTKKKGIYYLKLFAYTFISSFILSCLYLLFKKIISLLICKLKNKYFLK